MKAVILAGGSGTRLWPMSRAAKPKQFCELVSAEPLIRDTYRRLLRSFPAEKIYFSVSAALEKTLRENFVDLPEKQIIVEPEKRDTGPAMGYVAATLELDDPDEPIVFVPSDHFIGDEDKFLNCLKVGEQLILETGKMLDIGVVPSFPSTVLGYTKFGKKIETRDSVEVYEFLGHTEKPPFEVAKKYLEDGSYLWHASYYMWTPRKFMEAFETYAPEMAEILRKIQIARRGTKFCAPTDDICDLYSRLPKTSFDYAVTEKMDPNDVLIIKGDFGWSDIGAWDTLYDRLCDNGGNVVKGNSVLVETTGSLIYAPEGKTVAVLGMNDIVVVDTGDALLVCPKSQAQRVKEIISELQKKEQHDLL
ncbi:MAG: sugar phosphate nucleotidyltransferase [Patescibacteria group bacterium]|jgi:mannose-1-phosphate guanylyltransferase